MSCGAIYRNIVPRRIIRCSRRADHAGPHRGGTDNRTEWSVS